MANVIGIDIGYGYTKTYTRRDSEEYRDVFPTAISRVIPRETFSEIDIVMAQGKPFLVGEKASIEGLGVLDTRRADFVGSDAYYAVLGYALFRAGIDPDAIILGFPPGMLTKEYTMGLEKKLKAADIVVNGNAFAKNISLVRYIPQGAGIYFAHIERKNSDYWRNVAVADIGYHTVDMTFFAKGRYVENSAKSMALGVSQLYDHVKKEFGQKYRISLKNSDSIESLLQSGMIEITGTLYEFETSRLIAPYLDQLTSVIKTYIEGLPDIAEAVVLGGGGAIFLRNADITPEVGGLKHNLNIITDPQMANAKGFYHYGIGIMK